jgi:hypothetical protein
MEFEKIVEFLKENNVNFLIVNSSELIKKKEKEVKKEKEEIIINEKLFENLIKSIEELILILQKFSENSNIKNIYEIFSKFILK